MRVLIIKTSSLGDILQAFPVVNDLKARFPACEIDWVVEKGGAPLVKANPHISKLIEIDTKAWRRGKNLGDLYQCMKLLRKSFYDVVFDLQGNTKSAFFTLIAKSQSKVGFSRKCAPEWTNPFVTNFHVTLEKGRNIREDYLFVLEKFFGKKAPSYDLDVFLHFDEAPIDLNPDGAFLIFPGAHWKNKRFTAKEWISLLKLSKDPILVAWGKEEEKELANEITNELKNAKILPKCTLGQLYQLMTRVKCVMAMDSLPLHLAAVAGAPTESFFGPTIANKYRPLGKQHVSFQGACPYQVTFEKRCPYLRSCQTADCMRDAKDKKTLP